MTRVMVGKMKRSRTTGVADGLGHAILLSLVREVEKYIL